MASRWAAACTLAAALMVARASASSAFLGTVGHAFTNAVPDMTFTSALARLPSSSLTAVLSPPRGRQLGSVEGFAKPVAHAYIIQGPELNPYVVLQRKIYQLMRGTMKHAEIKMEGPTTNCPQEIPETRVMSDAAQAAWKACASPLVLMRVNLTASESQPFDELVTALEIISEDESWLMFYLSHPMPTKDALMHGPTFSKYMELHKAHVTNSVILGFAASIVLFVVLLMLARKAYHHVQPQSSARTPRFSGAMPLLLGLSLFTGSLLAPIAIAGYWLSSRCTKGSGASEPISTEEPDAEKEEFVRTTCRDEYGDE